MNTIHQEIINKITADIQDIEQNTALYEETNFDSRANAIDFIDFHILDRIAGLLQPSGKQELLMELKQRAEQLTDTLEQVDMGLFQKLRKAIAAGIYAGSSFKEMIEKHLTVQLNDFSLAPTTGYDNLDVFINGLLTYRPLPETTLAPEAEMIFYQKTPARIIFEMAERAQLSAGDIFFDIGSGLGQPAILVNLLSGVATRGIEYEPAYCNYARACAAQLDLPKVEFINTDARKADYSGGTIFFLYTPFEGNMLEEMLHILQKESQKRTIRVFTYGPCSPRVAQQKWLRCTGDKANDPDKLYEFVSLNTVQDKASIDDLY